MESPKVLLLSVVLMWSVSTPRVRAAQDSIRWEDGRAICESTLEWDAVPGSSLAVEVSSMDVIAIGGAANKVVMVEKMVLDVANEADAKKYYQKFRVELKKSGDDFQFTNAETHDPFRSGKLEFQVPSDFSASLTTSAGDLQVQNVNGSVRLATSGGDINVTSITGEISLVTSGGDIDLRNIEGNVHAMTSGGDIEVAHCRPKISVTTSGGDIDLSHLSGTVEAETFAGDVTLTGLEGDANLSSSGGDLDITDVTGGKSVKAITSGGDIIAQDIAADVSLETSSGDLDLKNITGSARAETSDGDISGNGMEGATINVKTSGGDITLANVSGAVTAVTSHGDITVEMKRSAPSNAIELTTSGGDVICTLPQGYRGSVQARIEAWSKYAYDDIISDFPLMVGTDKSQILTATGDINEGGPSIHLETTRGYIKLQKYSEP